MTMKLMCVGVCVMWALNAVAMPLAPGAWTATSDKGTASIRIGSDGAIEEIRIDGIDTGNPHFGVIDASYVLGRGYDHLEWTGNDFVAGFYSGTYDSTRSTIHTFRMTGTAISRGRIRATWSVFGSDSYIDASGEWQYESYALAGNTFTAEWASLPGGMTPVTGDFDGDGRHDMAGYRAADGQWFFKKSRDGFDASVRFGYTGTVPVVGDFDGDGIDDFGCYDAAGIPGVVSYGSWYFMLSTRGFRTATFGYGGTVPVVGDFDGDGTDDYGSYDPVSPGIWFLMKSTEGFSRDAFPATP